MVESCAKLVKRGEIKFLEHEKFKGVKIAKLIDKKINSKISVSILIIPPKASANIHKHENEIDSIFIVKGRGRAFINGSWVDVEEGDYIFVPPNCEHGIENNSKEELIILATHSPPLF